MREHSIKWITNARVTSVHAGIMHIETIAGAGSVKKRHDLRFAIR
jgi:sulfide:quinone oxidoreductase